MSSELRQLALRAKARNKARRGAAREDALRRKSSSELMEQLKRLKRAEVQGGGNARDAEKRRAQIAAVTAAYAEAVKRETKGEGGGGAGAEGGKGKRAVLVKGLSRIVAAEAASRPEAEAGESTGPEGAPWFPPGMGLEETCGLPVDASAPDLPPGLSFRGPPVRHPVPHPPPPGRTAHAPPAPAPRPAASASVAAAAAAAPHRAKRPRADREAGGDQKADPLDPNFYEEKRPGERGGVVAPGPAAAATAATAAAATASAPSPAQPRPSSVAPAFVPHAVSRGLKRPPPPG